ncbi:hypothetical protein LGT41_0003755 [Abyssibius alkaniclasticus]|uniref:hypothetical protein n=1 Tax=Abyssibius alkaniclasticus TaxID=2881234 RepID=UPI002363943D|nr:hypothetical protein [Abyssibius alkaniclasticus]UPH71945.1 hypothetical protein LGT41_0003755 [Abyssibius alkaniclasticus]|tara:strand:- start:779 stop:1027 length:249 start_codon:yes stop_codon:yes gene_type:complete
MKALLLASTLAFAAATATQAGGAVYVPPAASGVEAPMANSGPVNWLVPLAMIAIIVLATTNDDNPCRKAAAELSLIAAPCAK